MCQRANGDCLINGSKYVPESNKKHCEAIDMGEGLQVANAEMISKLHAKSDAAYVVRVVNHMKL